MIPPSLQGCWRKETDSGSAMLVQKKKLKQRPKTLPPSHVAARLNVPLGLSLRKLKSGGMIVQLVMFADTIHTPSAARKLAHTPSSSAIAG